MTFLGTYGSMTSLGTYGSMTSLGTFSTFTLHGNLWPNLSGEVCTANTNGPMNTNTLITNYTNLFYVDSS